MLKAYGAEVVVCPTAVAPEHPDSYYNVSDRLVARDPGAWKPDQYSNPNNPRSHYETTGPEIWEQTEGRITHFVAGVGTGGTISGIGRYLKEQNPDVQVIGADPAGSVYSGGTGRPYLVEGVGEDFWPEHLRPRRSPTGSSRSPTPTPSRFTRRLAREEALLVGGSSGHGGVRRDPARPRARRHARGRGRRDRRAAARLRPRLPHQGLQRRVARRSTASPSGADRTTQTVGEVLRGKDGRLPDLVHTHPERDHRRGGRTSSRSTASRRCPWSAPSRRSWPPRSPARSPSATLLDALFAGTAQLTDPVEDHMSPPLPTIGSTEPARDAVAAARERRRACWCTRTASRSASLTRQDLLAYLARG